MLGRSVWIRKPRIPVFGYIPSGSSNVVRSGAKSFHEARERRPSSLKWTSSAQHLGIRLERGVYIGVHGPEMETPAETRMYRQWGADAVGMSTVLEVIAARHLGIRVLGFSCLSNKNLPDCMAPAPLEEIIAVAGRAGAKLDRLLRALVTKL